MAPAAVQLEMRRLRGVGVVHVCRIDLSPRCGCALQELGRGGDDWLSILKAGRLDAFVIDEPFVQWLDSVTGERLPASDSAAPATLPLICSMEAG